MTVTTCNRPAIISMKLVRSSSVSLLSTDMSEPDDKLELEELEEDEDDWDEENESAWDEAPSDDDCISLSSAILESRALSSRSFVMCRIS